MQIQFDKTDFASGNTGMYLIWKYGGHLNGIKIEIKFM
jgi:hypothetical protein